MQNEYYKCQLAFNEIKAYDSICRALCGQSEYAELPGGLTNEQISRTYISVLYDHPEFFYAPRAIAACDSCGKVKVSLRSVYDKAILKKAEKAMSETARSLAIGKCDEVAAEKKVLDYFVGNATYEINDMFNQNAASAIYFKKAQCSGLPRRLNILLIGSEYGVLLSTARLRTWAVTVLTPGISCVSKASITT